MKAWMWILIGGGIVAVLGIGAVVVLGVIGYMVTNDPKTLNNENLTRSINTYYAQNPECNEEIRPEVLPITIPHVSADTMQGVNAFGDLFTGGQFSRENKANWGRINALVDAGIFKKTESTDESGDQWDRYEATDLANQYVTNDHLCYGNRSVQQIVLFSDPATDSSGLRVTHVKYNYTLTNVPNWASIDSVQEYFPQLHEQTSEAATAQDTLTLTNSGWVMAGTGK